jgi:hypothetical protein
MASIHSILLKNKKVSEFFVLRHVSEIDLPIFTRLATTELVEGLEEMESAMYVSLRANGAGLLDLKDGGLEDPGVKQGFQEGEKGLGAYV